MLNAIWMEGEKGQLTFYSPLYAYVNVLLLILLPCTHLLSLEMKRKKKKASGQLSLGWVSLSTPIHFAQISLLLVLTLVVLLAREK